MSTSVIPLPGPPSGEGLEVRPVSPKLVPVRFLANLAWWLVFVALGIGWHVLVALLDWPWWLHFLTMPLFLLVLQSIVFTPRRARALGYLTRESDLVFREGLLSRSLTILPYGRVQDIEIQEGLIERRFGLSTLTVKTAGGFLSNMTIPGLERDEAERIRDLVAREAHEKMAAL